MEISWQDNTASFTLDDGVEVFVHPPQATEMQHEAYAVRPLWRIELLMGGNTSVTIEGFLEAEANYWTIYSAEWWLDRRTPIDIDSGLPVAKMSSYDVAEKAVRTVRACRPQIEAGPPPPEAA